MTPDELFMQRALELAQLGTGQVSPNPRVGCVIVHDNKIIGEGWHQKFGEAHAEVNAINSVKDQSVLKKSTVYVNLEPCSHFGKTPPCVDLLIKHHVKKVVIANLDSNPLVQGQGIKKLKDVGIETITGVLEKEGYELNKRFFTFIDKQRPYIILKWAQTADGFIAQKNFESKWISNEFSRQLVHRWRSEEDAVLVGTRTASHDNPSLTVRDWTGRNPIRIVMDRFLRLNSHLQLFDKKEKTICYNVLKHEEHKNLLLVRIDENNFLDELVHDLFKRNIQSVIVEGGAQTLQLFIEANLWDEARVFTSPRAFGEGIGAPSLKGKIGAQQNIDSDRLEYFYPTTPHNH
jgi:diaminohydroxyphosphoribosylaminopyrimidine deaminase/5-amino-6-(5-phosphoribosylamino)uracil reductase